MEWAELDFEILISDVDETPDNRLNPEEIALDIATRKNNAVLLQFPELLEHIVVSADTIVVLDDEVIGKPQDREDAMQILGKLSGKKHRVITAVCIRDAAKSTSFTDTTFVKFHELTASQIEHYVDQYKPYDKAGAYAIQEWIGVVGIASIEGDFYNVMGLPISRVLQELKIHHSL